VSTPKGLALIYAYFFSWLLILWRTKNKPLFQDHLVKLSIQPSQQLLMSCNDYLLARWSQSAMY